MRCAVRAARAEGENLFGVSLALTSMTTQPSEVAPEVPDGAEVDAGAAERKDANAMMATGAGIAVIGIAGAVIGGAACPICVVAAPALLGIGAVRRLRARKRR